MRLRAVNALLTTIVVAGVLTSAVAASPVSADQRDSDSVPYYRDAVAWAQGAGVVSGCVPLGVATSRGEVITVIHKALGEPEARVRHPFLDIRARELQIPVAWAAYNGVTQGTSPTTFSPDALATRAQVAAFLWRASGRPSAKPSSFVDVKQDWQVAPIGWMTAQGVTTGRSTTHFDPDTAVTWAELITFVWRWLKTPQSPAGENDSQANCDVVSGHSSGW